MATPIQEIHQQVLNLLLRKHQEDKNFLFTMRKINRKGRLDKGYWFHGDDKYLTISFWTGRDWVARIPRVGFTITAEGSTYLEFSQKDVYQHIDYFELNLINNIGALPRNGDVAYVKDYWNFHKDDYLASLNHFLIHDKKIIDAAVLEQRAVSPLAYEYAEGMETLYPRNFKKELENIKKYQKKLSTLEKATGYLRTFKVENFFGIKRLVIPHIPEGCKWIFITGENGAGKTSLLKAIATGLCKNSDNGEPMVNPESPFKITIGMDTPQGIKPNVVTGNCYEKSSKWLPKGFAAYGPVRLFTQGSLDPRIFNVENINNSRGATFGLFNSIDILQDLSEPMPLLDRPKYHQMAEDSFMENLHEILFKLFQMGLAADGTLEYRQKDQPYVETGGKIEFKNLPSGIRNFCAIIIDLVRRLRIQQTNVWDPSEHNGIILIDEIDLHLHPKMQKEIVIQLSETFPNIQFIVTTHSPIPLLGAPKNSLFVNVLQDIDQGITAHVLDIEVQNLLPNTILSSPIFDFTEISSVQHNPSERLVSEDDYEENIFFKILERKLRERTIRRNEQ